MLQTIIEIIHVLFYIIYNLHLITYLLFLFSSLIKEQNFCSAILGLDSSLSSTWSTKNQER